MIARRALSISIVVTSIASAFIVGTPRANAAVFADARLADFARAGDVDSDDTGFVPFDELFEGSESASAPAAANATASSNASQTSHVRSEGSRLQNVTTEALLNANGSKLGSASGTASLHVSFSFRRRTTITIRGSLTTSGSPGDACATSELILYAGGEEVIDALARTSTPDDSICLGGDEPDSVPLSNTIEVRPDTEYDLDLTAHALVDGDSDTDPAFTASAAWNVALTIGSGGAACGDVLTRSVLLDLDLDCDTTALTIGADNITVDLGGHTVSGDFEVGDFGIDNSGGHHDVTIRNGTITGFGHGVNMVGATGARVKGLLLFLNTVDGMRMADTGPSVVRNVTARENGGDGLHLDCEGCEIANNLLDNNGGDGLEVTGDAIGAGSTITGNRSQANTRDGIGIRGTLNGNTLLRNKATLNLENGFEIETDDNVLKEHNVALDNGFNGFRLTTASRTKVTGNEARGNAQIGFITGGGEENTLRANEAISNGQAGIAASVTSTVKLIDNLAQDNAGPGFALASVLGTNVVKQNRAVLNRNGVSSGHGFLFGGSQNIAVTENLARQNFGTGYLLVNADSNRLTANRASANGVDGFWVDRDSGLNVLNSNGATHNVAAGFTIDNLTTTGRRNQADGNGDDCAVVTGAAVTCG